MDESLENIQASSSQPDTLATSHSSQNHMKPSWSTQADNTEHKTAESRSNVAELDLSPGPSNAEDQQLSELTCRSDFEEFLNFSFPEDDEFNATGNITDPFYFESDHVALKGNEDYRRLLRAFIILESQRTAALHDLDKLLKRQKKALSDPIQFVDGLCRADGREEFPAPRRVAELPSIPWERYTDDVDSVLSSFGGSHHMTRLKQRRELMNGIRLCVDESPVTVTKSEPIDGEKPEIRPATFNQSWSVEEQRKLEHLLKKYPPERFESRRWGKIARELPGRSTQQVASRVQKYFIKLARAGLPVPGRMPNVAAYGGRLSNSSMHRHQRYNRFLYPSSTFMTSYEPPVYMSDDDENDMDDNMTRDTSDYVTDDGTIASCLLETPEYRQLQTLIALQKQQQHQDGLTGNSTEPIGIKKEPGVECNRSELPRSSYVDPDYASLSTGVSSYLDPNYEPVS